MLQWQRVVQRIITLEPVRVAEILESNHILFSRAIPFMVHTPVMGVLLCCIETFTRIGISRKLMWLVRQASRNVCAPDELGLGSVAVVLTLLESYGESFMRLEKEQSTKEFAFFLPLTEGEFISRLLSSIRSGVPSSAHAFYVLVAYTKLGGSLSRIVVNNIAALGEAVLHLEENRSVIHDKLTFTRWGLVNVLSTLAINPESSKQTLDAINTQVWSALSSWFLRYPLSSLYQQQFFELVKIAVNAQHEKSLHTLFVVCDFLSKMMEFYKSSTPGSKAHTHLISILLKEAGTKYEGVAGLLEKPLSFAHHPHHTKLAGNANANANANEKKKRERRERRKRRERSKGKRERESWSR